MNESVSNIEGRGFKMADDWIYMMLLMGVRSDD